MFLDQNNLLNLLIFYLAQSELIYLLLYMPND